MKWLTAKFLKSNSLVYRYLGKILNNWDISRSIPQPDRSAPGAMAEGPVNHQSPSTVGERLGATKPEDAGDLPAIGLPDLSCVASSATDGHRRLVSTLPMDDPRFVVIVGRFAKRLHDELQTMDNARETGDFHLVSQKAHWLKGTGGTLGFDAFTVPARRLEHLAKKRDHAGVQRSLAELRGLAARIHIPQAASHADELSVDSDNKTAVAANAPT